MWLHIPISLLALCLKSSFTNLDDALRTAAAIVADPTTTPYSLHEIEALATFLATTPSSDEQRVRKEIANLQKQAQNQINLLNVGFRNFRVLFTTRAASNLHQAHFSWVQLYDRFTASVSDSIGRFLTSDACKMEQKFLEELEIEHLHHMVNLLHSPRMLMKSPSRTALLDYVASRVIVNLVGSEGITANLDETRVNKLMSFMRNLTTVSPTLGKFSRALKKYQIRKLNSAFFEMILDVQYIHNHYDSLVLINHLIVHHFEDFPPLHLPRRLTDSLFSVAQILEDMRLTRLEAFSVSNHAQLSIQDKQESLEHLLSAGTLLCMKNLEFMDTLVSENPAFLPILAEINSLLDSDVAFISRLLSLVS
jgi:hypothetical protein